MFCLVYGVPELCRSTCSILHSLPGPGYNLDKKIELKKKKEKKKKEQTQETEQEEKQEQEATKGTKERTKKQRNKITD